MKDGHPFVTDKEGRDREIILQGEEDEALKKVWEDLPLNMGIKKAYPYISSKYVGITKDRLFEWMKKSKFYQKLHQKRNASHSKAIISESPGKHFQVDTFMMPTSVPFNGRSYKACLMIVDVYSKLVVLKPIWGDENGEKDAQLMREFLDSEYGQKGPGRSNRQWGFL